MRWLLVSALFELLGEFSRSEQLCRKALRVAKQDEDQNRFRQAEWTYQLRLARLQIRQHRISAAAATFKIAAEGSLGFRGDKVAITSGAAVYAVLAFADASLESCSDSEIVKFFEDLEGQFSADVRIRAWLLYKKSECLFNRLLVQAARRILLKAEELARSCDEYELQWALLYSKLFVHVDQVYRDQALWFRDALEAGLLLAKDQRIAVRRSDFVSVVTRVSARYRSAMGEVASVITEFNNRSSIDPFWIALFALWKVANRNRFVIGCLSEVERFLRDCGSIASNDFG